MATASPMAAQVLEAGESLAAPALRQGPTRPEEGSLPVVPATSPEALTIPPVPVVPPGPPLPELEFTGCKAVRVTLMKY